MVYTARQLDQMGRGELTGSSHNFSPLQSVSANLVGMKCDSQQGNSTGEITHDRLLSPPKRQNENVYLFGDTIVAQQICRMMSFYEKETKKVYILQKYAVLCVSLAP